MIYLDLFWTFFKIGAFTFGGGYAMLAMIQVEVVKKGWATEEMILNYLAISESTPGPFAVNASTFVGTTQGGILGGLCSTIGVVLPAFLIILLVAKMYEKYKKSRAVAGCMSGLKPAVVGLIAAAILSSTRSVVGVFFDGWHLIDMQGFVISLVIFIIAFIMQEKKINPITVILTSLVLGLVAGYSGMLGY